MRRELPRTIRRGSSHRPAARSHRGFSDPCASAPFATARDPMVHRYLPPLRRRGHVGLDLHADRPNESQEFAADRGHHLVSMFAPPGELAKLARQPVLRFPGDPLHRGRHSHLTFPQGGPDGGRCRYAQAASITMRRRCALPDSVYPPWCVPLPPEASLGTAPLYPMNWRALARATGGRLRRQSSLRRPGNATQRLQRRDHRAHGRRRGLHRGVKRLIESPTGAAACSTSCS